jgi:hypothetical protein
MSVALYFPIDEFDRQERNFDLAADYLELTAFFSTEHCAFTKDLINASEIGAAEDYADVDEEVLVREEIVSGTVTRIVNRQKVLGKSYPFALDENGDLLTYQGDEPTLGQAAYVLCLVLSHLKSVSPILSSSVVYPSDAEIRQLRQYFQYFATAALAAEIGGQAWSFGHPRLAHSGFLEKLKQIWATLRDGRVAPDELAPSSPQDDQIDIFAWRGHFDGLPGFLLAGAQVATGKNWKDKSIKSHLTDVFWKRWFERPPVSQMVCYHIVPFARPDVEFRDDVLVLGNVLHRLRVPRRVDQADALHAQGVPIEAFDELPHAVEWIKVYRKRGLEAT